MSYYELNGLGATGSHRRHAFFGFGAVDFDANAVWSQWASGEPGATKAAKQIQATLSALGFDTQGVDGRWGPNSTAAWQAFLKSQGIAASTIPSKTGIYALGEAAKGPPVGPTPPKPYVQVTPDTWIPAGPPGTDPKKRRTASMLMVGGGILGVGAIVAAVVLSKKKRPAAMHANRKAKHRRR